MKIIFFDICALFVYAAILLALYDKKLTVGFANRLFIELLWISLALTGIDIAMEFVAGTPPLSRSEVVLGYVLSTAYKALRNGTSVLYLIFVFAVTRTTYRLRSWKNKAILLAPYAALLALLLANPVTHGVFRITEENGYARGPQLIWLYVISGLYAAAGVVYLFLTRGYLGLDKWLSLAAFYLFVFTAVIIEMFYPQYLVEMFASAFVSLLIMLFVFRPEEVTDMETGLLNNKAYRDEVHKLILSKQSAQVLAIRFINADEVRTYIGEDFFNAYIIQAAGDIKNVLAQHMRNCEIYYERPGSLYTVLDDISYDGMHDLLHLFAERRNTTDKFTELGVRLLPRVCHIRCPDDLNSTEGILYLSREFTSMVPQEKASVEASEVVGSAVYALGRGIDDVLKRAIMENRFEMYYQPIYSVKEQRFCTAEALIRLRDNEMGYIPPGYFVPAAESRGLILPIGDFVLEAVYRFLSENDLDAMGMSYVEINLSVAQCLQTELPDRVRQLEEKYGVSPERVNFEITETTYGSVGGVMEENIRRLSERGYTFSLDDYGTGYSNIQRISRLPLKIIKIDKSVVDDMGSESGRSIMRNTVRMMREIGKELVVEGIETQEMVKMVTAMGCDYIQGFYYARPMPEKDFVRFMREQMK
ncbi:MAG: EAL domain-containing protein [Ruminococcaceae bacterium]|nr:EAL domain-containing protein [Oscillospiraceae bacterium]